MFPFVPFKCNAGWPTVPLFSVIILLPLPSAPLLLIHSEPAATVTLLVKLLVPLKTSVAPGAFSVSAPLPPIVPPTVSTWLVATVHV